MEGIVIKNTQITHMLKTSYTHPSHVHQPVRIELVANLSYLLVN